MSPLFLTVEQVKSIQSEMIREYGGIHGVRDEGLLLSACEMPLSGFGENYFHDSLEYMAAAYLFHLVKNHPFVDGNKRVGLAAALTFLDANHLSADFDLKDDVLEAMVLEVASGKMTKEQVRDFFKNHCKKS